MFLAENQHAVLNSDKTEVLHVSSLFQHSEPLAPL